MDSMKQYRVLLKGENFLLNNEGEIKRMGFYTTRFVDAPNEDEAELTAVELIRKDNWLREAVRNDRPDPPMIFAEEIEEISTFDNPGAGFTFYEEEPSAE